MTVFPRSSSHSDLVPFPDKVSIHQFHDRQYVYRWGRQTSADVIRFASPWCGILSLSSLATPIHKYESCRAKTPCRPGGKHLAVAIKELAPQTAYLKRKKGKEEKRREIGWRDSTNYTPGQRFGYSSFLRLSTQNLISLKMVLVKILNIVHH